MQKEKKKTRFRPKDPILYFFGYQRWIISQTSLEVILKPLNVLLVQYFLYYHMNSFCVFYDVWSYLFAIYIHWLFANSFQILLIWNDIILLLSCYYYYVTSFPACFYIDMFQQNNDHINTKDDKTFTNANKKKSTG